MTADSEGIPETKSPKVAVNSALPDEVRDAIHELELAYPETGGHNIIGGDYYANKIRAHVSSLNETIRELRDAMNDYTRNHESFGDYCRMYLSPVLDAAERSEALAEKAERYEKALREIATTPYRIYDGNRPLLANMIAVMQRESQTDTGLQPNGQMKP